MIDFLIIGSGLAGISFAETALQNNKSILVFENNSQNSTRVAGGLYNPVVLKRFSAVWNALEQIKLLDKFYSKIENKLHVKFNFKIPVYRKFFSVEEQNNWFAVSDKPELSPFLNLDLIFKKFKAIDSPFGYGEVLQTGYVDTATLLEAYRKYLIDNNWLVIESFDYYSQLEITDDFVVYKDIKAKNVIFAEGFGLHANPYFNYLPLDGTKGELFIIKASGLDLNVIVNTSMFIVPLGNDLYKVGATYHWSDKSNLPTEEGRRELIDRIKEILNCDFEIVEHFAGVRPTVRDRKPLVGSHPDYRNIAVLNGLGTRGVMLGPEMAKNLFEYLEYGKPLDPAIDIIRYAKKR